MRKIAGKTQLEVKTILKNLSISLNVFKMFTYN
jgi:hypothetical protein